MTHILITHGHGDHVGDAVAISEATGAKVITNYDLCMVLAGEGLKNFDPMNTGGTTRQDGFQVSMTRAYHSAAMQVKGAWVPAGDPNGLVVRAKDEPTIYHMGDTDVFSDMSLIAEMYRPEVVMCRSATASPWARRARRSLCTASCGRASPYPAIMVPSRSSIRAPTASSSWWRRAAITSRSWCRNRRSLRGEGRAYVTLRGGRPTSMHAVAAGTGQPGVPTARWRWPRRRRRRADPRRLRPAIGRDRPAALGIAVDGRDGGRALIVNGGARAVADGEMVGLVLWAEKDGGLDLGRLVVRPDRRGQGIAHALVGAAEDEVRRRGLPRLHLGTALRLPTTVAFSRPAVSPRSGSRRMPATRRRPRS